MTARRPLPVRAVAAALVAVAAAGGGRADDSPAGKPIARVVPVGNRVHPAEQIVGQLRGTRAGRAYDEAAVADDVRRLLATRWFAAGGVRVSTAVDPTGQVTVYVHVVELSNTVREVVFVGAQHLSEKELLELTGVRRGGPLNPTDNQLAAVTVQNKLRDDGRYWATCRLLDGDELTDDRVVFDIVEGPVVRVGGVEFRGNQAATTGRLRTVVSTTGPLVPGVPTVLTPKFTPQLVADDRQKLLDYYHRLGHLEARVEPEVLPVPGTLGAVRVVYHIREGRPFHVRDVRVSGNKAFADDRLRQVTGLKPGDRYDRDVVQADVGRMRTVYGNGGLNAGVEEGVFAVPGQPGVVDVQYRVSEPAREPARVGRVLIEGNTYTQDRVILNQLGLFPGQVLQFPRLRQAEQNLGRLQLFDPEDPPTVEALPPDDDSPFYDVLVRVKETRTGMVMFGANVNSDAGVNGSITVNQRNFDLFRLPTSWDDLTSGRAFRGGGQEFRLEALPGSQFQRYSATWREPFLFDSRFGLTQSLYYYDRGFAEYNESRYGARTTVDYRFQDSQIWRASASARVEGVTVRDVPDFAPRDSPLRRDVGDSTVFGLRAGLNRDTRDSFLLPTEGSVLDLGVEQVLGDYTFPIATAEGSLYQTVYQRKDGSGKHVVAVRSQVSVAGDDAPVFERFYAGGFRSLRGFSFRGVGPRDATNLNLGGTFAFLNTVEYQLPVLANDKLYLVGFVDHGTVERSVKIDEYRVSVGFGARVVVPALGPLPIALDFAFPVTKAPGDNRQVFSFYVGWFGGQ